MSNLLSVKYVLMQGTYLSGIVSYIVTRPFVALANRYIPGVQNATQTPRGKERFMTKLLKIEEAADMFSLVKSTVYELSNKKKLNSLCYTVRGKLYQRALKWRYRGFIPPYTKGFKEFSMRQNPIVEEVVQLKKYLILCGNNLRMKELKYE